MVLIMKRKMIMMTRKVAVPMMNRKKLLVQSTKPSGRKYKPLLVRLWLIWKNRFVLINWVSIECRKTKTKAITYQLDYSTTNLKPQ